MKIRLKKTRISQYKINTDLLNFQYHNDHTYIQLKNINDIILSDINKINLDYFDTM